MNFKNFHLLLGLERYKSLSGVRKKVPIKYPAEKDIKSDG